MNQVAITKLVTYIEENLRASPTAGLSFVDSRNYQTRLRSRQNHVVFGRRGAGKTSLVSSIEHSGEHIYVYLNLEDYKDITFPNIVLHILIELFKSLLETIQEQYPWYSLWHVAALRAKRELHKTIVELKQYLHEPDVETQHISTIEDKEQGVEVSHGLVGVRAGRNRASEIKREIRRSKLNHLRLELSAYKKLISFISSLFDNKPVFLVLDDFYFVAKATQPDLVDYFHRLTKGTSLFIKVATIKHRSKLYRRKQDRYVGVELGHDIFEIDMDYTLDNFDELRSFMRELLANAVEQSHAGIDIEEIFAGDGFPQLCLASGGVPRDFLSLFVTLANQATSTGQTIGKVQVTDAAIANVKSKFASMQQDSGDEDVILEHCLYQIRNYVWNEKRTNAFLIAKPDLEEHSQGRQAIRELVDLRLIHLVERNTSKAPSDGRRYEAYIIDLGLYENARPRNFDQVEPGLRDEKSRKDALRASPVFELQRLTQRPLKEMRTSTVTPSATDTEQVEQLGLELSFE